MRKGRLWKLKVFYRSKMNHSLELSFKRLSNVEQVIASSAFFGTDEVDWKKLAADLLGIAGAVSSRLTLEMSERTRSTSITPASLEVVLPELLSRRQHDPRDWRLVGFNDCNQIACAIQRLGYTDIAIDLLLDREQAIQLCIEAFKEFSIEVVLV